MGEVRARGALWLTILGVAVGCAGSNGPSARRGVGAREAPDADEVRARVVSLTIGDDVVPPESARGLRGAAAALTEPEVPRDIVGLAARMEPRAIPMPQIPAGMTERFTFDGYRRGWLARLPAAQALLTPAYADGKIYVGGGFRSSSFFAYDARSGQPLWTVSAPDGGPSAAVIDEEKVLFNTESCTLFAIDAHTGEHLWRRWLGDPLMSQPASAGGLVFSGHVIDRRSPGRIRPGTTGWGTGGGRRYGFTALRLRDGRPRWTRPISADVMNGPVLDDRGVFFTTMDGAVYHLDRRSGRVRWRRELGATSAPWLHDEQVHVTVGERRAEGPRRERTLVLDRRRGETLRALDAVDAAFLAERADSGGVRAGWAYEGSRPTVLGSRSYQTIGNEVHARDASNGALLWRRAYTAEATSRPASPPAVVGSQVIFGTRDGQLFGLDVDTGMTAWAWDVGEPIAAQPSVAHGWVYASTTAGGVVALEVADPTLDGWHMWGGSASHNGLTAGTTAPLEYAGRPSEGTLRLGDEPNHGELGGFPIQRTDVSVSVTGFVAHVRVQQTYQNPYERPVEGSYLFPVPDGAAVDGMELRAGDRIIRAQIRSRDDVGRAAEGQTSGVLVQERPDVFRQTVRNIPPSDDVRVTLEYTQVLRYEDGAYHFAFPLRAGPRYERATGDGYNPEGTPLEVELGPGDERPDEVRLTVDADLGAAIAGVDAADHRVAVERRGRRTRIRLDSPARPDADFALRMEVGSERPEVAVVASPPGDGAEGHFALALHPIVGAIDDDRAPRELVVVLDTSASMQGLPLERARAAITRALTTLTEGDALRVLTLDGRVSGEVVPATRSNVAAAIRRLGAAGPSGELASLDGLRAALEMPPPGERVRLVALFTDGFVGSERDVFELVRPRVGEARLFAFGVGATVNRYLLTRLTELGRGAFEAVRLDEAPDAAAERFVAHVARPQMTDLSIDWGELDVREIYPRRVPDVYANRPVVVHGRYRRGGDGVIRIRGRLGGRPFEQVVDVRLPRSGPRHPELASMWAQTRVRDLMTAMALRPSPELEREATELAVAHHLLTPFTTFVALDSTAGGRSRIPIAEGSAAVEGSASGRPERDTGAPIVACYAQARDDEGVVDPEALAACLATIDAEPR